MDGEIRDGGWPEGGCMSERGEGGWVGGGKGEWGE